MRRTRENTADPSTGFNNQKPALYMPKPVSEQEPQTETNEKDLPHNEGGGTNVFKPEAEDNDENHYGADLSYNMGDDEIVSHRMHPKDFNKTEQNPHFHNEEDTCLWQ